MTPGEGSRSLQNGPISVAEFFDAFFLLWSKYMGHSGRSRNARLGIAVSGGVDSMALASLCAGLVKYQPARERYNFEFMAFIVDHRAREGSDFEAKKTKNKLYSMGLSSRIINLSWPPGVTPLELSDFESQARRLRYQALGKACHEQAIRNILLAHHEDDQAETALMRLASGHRGIGVQGMRPSVSIPECWGIYGVHESGGWDQVTCRQSTAEREDPSSPVTHDLNHLLSSYDTFESGGIMIHRPLLGFSKQRLIDTCHNLSVTWEEDKTNQDASRTPRNTIRALLRGAALPQALQKKSILDLITRASECNRTLVRTAEYMFSRCEILLFDARSGGLIVRLPTELVTLQLLYHRKKRLAALISSVAMLLRRLVDSVTPQEEVSLQSLKHAVMSTFRILNDTGDVSTRLQPTRFTVAGVEFQRIHLPLPEQRSGPRPVSVRTERRVISGRELDPLYVWKITRQPFYRSPRSVLVLPSKSNSLSVSSKEHESTNTSPWCTWQLWDGRYWIRILNRSSHTVIVRNFQSSDIENVRCSLGRERWKGFHERLRLAVPGKTRWTLPAIAELSGGDNHSGKVLALPSLGQLGIIEVANEKGETTVEWEIRYKHIMLGHSIGDENAVRNRDVITTWKK